MHEPISQRWCMWGLSAVALVFMLTAVGLINVQAQEKKPNILVIFGDDIGQSNISAYTHGLMGYKTPNILNAEEEPERPYYPKNDPQFVKYYSPRGVLHTFADGKTVDTGPLNRKRMETIDHETSKAAVDFIQRQAKAGTPFFVWFNSTRMHLFTHIRPEYQGRSGMPGNFYADGMLEHDGHVGLLLKTLDDLGIANDTIVVYTTDNGPNMFSWPDAAMTPFRSAKDSNWEGAFRAPAMVRWPGRIKPGQISNELPPDYKGKVPQGYFTLRSRTYGVFVFWRAFFKDPKQLEAPVKLIEQTRIYPLGKQANAEPMQFPDASKVPANMLYPLDGSAFDMLARFIEHEYVDPADGHARHAGHDRHHQGEAVRS